MSLSRAFLERIIHFSTDWEPSIYNLQQIRERGLESAVSVWLCHYFWRLSKIKEVFFPQDLHSACRHRLRPITGGPE